MIKAVLFDMDGVLVDTEWFYNKRREAYLAECGITYDQFPDLTGVSHAKTWEILIPNNASLRNRLCEEYGPYCERHPVPYGELLNTQVNYVFTELHNRGVKTAIASSSFRDMIDEVIRVAAIEDVLDYSISGFECDSFKPSPEIYVRAMAQLEVEPGECLVVEDSPTGIESGLRSGARVLALKPREGVTLDQHKAHRVIEGLGDVLEEL